MLAPRKIRGPDLAAAFFCHCDCAAVLLLVGLQWGVAGPLRLAPGALQRCIARVRGVLPLPAFKALVGVWFAMHAYLRERYRAQLAGFTVPPGTASGIKHEESTQRRLKSEQASRVYQIST